MNWSRVRGSVNLNHIYKRSALFFNLYLYIKPYCSELLTSWIWFWVYTGALYLKSIAWHIYTASVTSGVYNIRRKFSLPHHHYYFRPPLCDLARRRASSKNNAMVASEWWLKSTRMTLMSAARELGYRPEWIIYILACLFLLNVFVVIEVPR
jgi:hypothetical protein